MCEDRERLTQSILLPQSNWRKKEKKKQIKNRSRIWEKLIRELLFNMYVYQQQGHCLIIPVTDLCHCHCLVPREFYYQKCNEVDQLEWKSTRANYLKEFRIIENGNGSDDGIPMDCHCFSLYKKMLYTSVWFWLVVFSHLRVVLFFFSWHFWTKSGGFVVVNKLYGGSQQWLLTQRYTLADNIRHHHHISSVATVRWVLSVCFFHCF